MFKRLKKVLSKKSVITDALILAAMGLSFATSYDIDPHFGTYLLSVELAAVAIMMARSGED
jgi:hypothetical protein